MKTKFSINNYILSILFLTIGIVIGRYTQKDIIESTEILDSLQPSHMVTDVEISDNISGLNITSGYSDLHPNVEKDSAKSSATSIAEQHATKRVKTWESQHSEHYAVKLLEIGIDEKLIPGIIEKRKQLVEFSASDKVLRQLMQKERFKYLKEIEINTTPEQYAEYLEYEKLKPAVRELENMDEEGIYITGGLQPEEVKTLQKWMVKYGLLTNQPWDGPLDPLPNPLVGTERVVENIINRHANMKDNLPQILEDMTENGFSNIAVENMKEYFVNKMNGLQRSYDHITNEHKLTEEEMYEQAMHEMLELQTIKIHQDGVSQRLQQQFDQIKGDASN
jgi:hypothetical protein